MARAEPGWAPDWESQQGTGRRGHSLKEHIAMGVILLETMYTSEINPPLKETFATGEGEKQESRNAEIGLGLYWKQISNGLV